MIQRQQTLWLTLASILCYCSFGFPFYSGTKQVIERTLPGVNLSAGDTFPLLVFTLFTGIGAIAAIFLYKKRKIQFRVALSGLVLSLLVIFFYFVAIKSYDNGNVLLTSLFTFAIPVCFIMALRGIRHDEKLTRSLDKLR